MDREALEVLKKLCSELTPGPWQLVAQNEEGMICIPHPHWDLCTVEESPTNVACILTNGEQGETPDADLCFMVAARTALPQLIAEVERLERENSEMQSVVDAAIAWNADTDRIEDTIALEAATHEYLRRPIPALQSGGSNTNA